MSQNLSQSPSPEMRKLFEQAQPQFDYQTLLDSISPIKQPINETNESDEKSD